MSKIFARRVYNKKAGRYVSAKNCGLMCFESDARTRTIIAQKKGFGAFLPFPTDHSSVGSHVPKMPTE